MKATLLIFWFFCRSLGWRLGLQAVTGSAISLFFLGLFYRSASLYHPQRRAILHLKDMSKRKGKDKNKIESKPPYFDFSALAIPPFQVLLTAICVASAGIYTPLFFLVSITRIGDRKWQVVTEVDRKWQLIHPRTNVRGKFVCNITDKIAMKNNFHIASFLIFLILLARKLTLKALVKHRIADIAE